MYFPPEFFDIMVHLLVHIVEDIVHLRPMFLHSMIDPWVEEHNSFIANKYSDRGEQRMEGAIINEHNSNFMRWFKDKILANLPPMQSSEEEKLIFALS
jgi:hypothetical protein